MLKAIDWLTRAYWNWRVAGRQNPKPVFGDRPDRITFDGDEATFHFKAEEIRLFSQVALAIAQRHAGPNGLALAFEHPAGKYEVNINRADGMTAAEIIAEAQHLVAQMETALLGASPEDVAANAAQVLRLRRILAVDRPGDDVPLVPRHYLEEEIKRLEAEVESQRNGKLMLEAYVFEYEAALEAIRYQVRKLVDSEAVPEESYDPLRAINEIYGNLVNPAGEGGEK